MSLEKRIMLYSDEFNFLQASGHRLKKLKPYYRIFKNHKRVTIIDLLQETQRFFSRGKETMDLLVILYDADVDHEDNVELISRLSLKLAELRTQILFVVSEGIRSSSHGRCHGISLVDFVDDIQLLNCLDVILGEVNVRDEDRVRIVDLFGNKSPLKYDEFDEEAKLIVDKLRSSHLFTEDSEFIKNSVLYEKKSLMDYEEEVYKGLKYDYRYLESLDEFHTVVTRNPRRMTHLLVGDRGCGKSSFIHHYFRAYEKFNKLQVPYVIVDFFRYGFVGDRDNVRWKTIHELYSYLHKTNHGLSRKYKDAKDLFSSGEVLNLINILKEEDVKFQDVVSDRILLNICSEIGSVGFAHLGMRAVDNFSITEKKAEAIGKELMRERPWDWLISVWEYISDEHKDRPFRYFVDWVMERCFEKQDIARYANSRLFLEKMTDFHEKYSMNSLSNLAKLVELSRFFGEFLGEVTERIGKFYIVLDNLDRLRASLAEFMIMETVQSCIALKYERLKFIVAIRPSSLDLARRAYKLDDTERFKKHGIKKVHLKKVIVKRLESISDEHNSPKERKIINSIHEVVNAPMKLYKAERGRRDVFDLINGLTGNNIRLGLELFADLILSPYKRLGSGGGVNLFRKIKKGVYIAEHMAVRAIFLGMTEDFRFSDDLINIFYLERTDGYQGTLVQIRVLEILKHKRMISLQKVYEYLMALGYSNEIIGDAIEELCRARLILVRKLGFEEPGSEHIDALIRYRGDYYYDKLVNRLSYIQLCYFMCKLHKPYAKRLSFPNLPKVKNKELLQLTESFLRYLSADIHFERNKASKLGISRYEREICSLQNIHRSVATIYEDYKRIWDES